MIPLQSSLSPFPADPQACIPCHEVSALVCCFSARVHHPKAGDSRSSVLGHLVQGLAPFAKRLPTRRRALPPCRYSPRCSPGFPSCHLTGARLRGFIPCEDAMSADGITRPWDRSPLRVPPPLGLLPSPRAAGPPKRPRSIRSWCFSHCLDPWIPKDSWALAVTDRLQRIARE